MHSDPIADMLTRIRNAIMAGHDSVEVPASRTKAEIARILKESGYIADWSLMEGLNGRQGALKIYLKYLGPKRNVIAGIERVSRPGRRVYVGRREIPQVLKGLGVAVLSTTKGVMTGEDARKAGLGGEVLLKVW